jgi:predicted ABC-type ATPase
VLDKIQNKDNPPVLSDKEILDLFTEKIFPEYKRKFDRVEFPRLAILAGPPGSGKSTIYKIIKKGFGLKCRPLHIDYDQLCLEYPYLGKVQTEKYHKDMPLYTADAATTWKRMMLDKGLEEKANVVYEHPLHKKEFIEGVIRKYKTANYGIDLHCVVVNSKQSIQGIFGRYVMAEATKPYTGRTVIPLDIHHKAYFAYPQTAQYLQDEKLVDTITVYNRDEALFENALKDGIWEKPQKIEAVINDERNRMWSQEEKNKLVAEWNKIDAIWQKHMEGKTLDPVVSQFES